MFFAIKASHGGHTMDLIEGEMQEESPFTFWDLVKQRQRWIQGNFMAALSHKFNLNDIPLITKYIHVFLTFTVPFNLIGDVTGIFWPLSFTPWDLLLGYLNELVYQYVFMVGIYYNFNLKKLTWFQKAYHFLPTVIWARYLRIVESFSLYCSFTQKKDQFYIVKK